MTRAGRTQPHHPNIEVGKTHRHSMVRIDDAIHALTKRDDNDYGGPDDAGIEPGKRRARRGSFPTASPAHFPPLTSKNFPRESAGHALHHQPKPQNPGVSTPLDDSFPTTWYSHNQLPRVVSYHIWVAAPVLPTSMNICECPPRPPAGAS
jgi:hypothetical protein